MCGEGGRGSKPRLWCWEGQFQQDFPKSIILETDKTPEIHALLLPRSSYEALGIFGIFRGCSPGLRITPLALVVLLRAKIHFIMYAVVSSALRRPREGLGDEDRV